MKAIYINLDPYLAQIAAWLKAGKPGTVPFFDPLPLAITVPLGQSVAVFRVGGGDPETDPADNPGSVSVGSGSVDFWDAADDGIPANPIATNVVPGFSDLDPTAKYFVTAVSGGTETVTVHFRVFESPEDENPVNILVTFTVLVRRETASGPVDLVDFTPPAAAPSAADIKTALVAAGETALEGVALGGAVLLVGGDGGAENPTLVGNDASAESPLILDPGDTDNKLGTGSAS